MAANQQGMIAVYGFWGNHPDHPVADWRDEVASDDTRLGYWDWVAARIDS